MVRDKPQCILNEPPSAAAGDHGNLVTGQIGVDTAE